MNKYEKFDKNELKELQRALRCYIGELDWSCDDTEAAQSLLDEVENELGERFNYTDEITVDGD